MVIEAVLFDSSGTLLRIESAERRLRAVLDGHDIKADDDTIRMHARRLDASGGLPGGTRPQSIPDHLKEVWPLRDENAETHRAAFTGLAREAALPWPQLYDSLYERSFVPDAWQPYPDAADVLAGLREQGVKTALVTNVGFDWRPIYRAHGLDDFLDAYVQSYELGVTKPDPRIFQAACDALGVAPERALMVGDERTADGGAEAIGCRYLPVDPLPVHQRPAALRPVLEMVG
ncbi:HAD family hydrolase [Streptomyces sp. NPDC050504]|uniref:HAD family hydrolase n=1 Tax=Streptomyces sp. NPDC050504 TaxID=3365618 RepID=UPI00378E27DF